MQSFVELYQDFDSFFTRHVYHKIRDNWNVPIASLPGSEFELLERYSDDHYRTFKYVYLRGGKKHVFFSIQVIAHNVHVFV